MFSVKLPTFSVCGFLEWPKHQICMLVNSLQAMAKRESLGN